MKILIAGGTGFLGSPLTSRLRETGHTVVLLSRNAAPGSNALPWDGETLGAWAEEMETSDAVINLAGTSIAEKRWTKEQKKLIENSRVRATRVLVQAIERASRRPSVLINASAAGYYGNVPEGDVSETSPRGEGFLAETCERWEQEARGAGTLGVRTVLLRTGVVLGKEGGALPKMIAPFRFFLGGPLGGGLQWVPWIHREDVLSMILFALRERSFSGPVNVSTPNPLRMRDFCHELGNALGRPSWVPVPAFALRLLLGEMAALLLEGQKALPQKMLERGYSFKFPDLRPALLDILG